MEEESEIKDYIEFDKKKDANEMNVIYEKIELTSTQDEKEKDVLQDGDGDGYENGRENGSDSSEKERDNNEGTVVVKGNLVGGFVNLDGEVDADAIKKQVRFHLEEDEHGEDTNFGINITVADAVNRVLLVEEYTGNDEAGKHKIDDIYENFPSSQVSSKKFFENLEQKEKEKKEYRVETEDISDVEENNTNDVEKGKKKETDVNRSDVQDKEQEKNESNEVEQKSGEIDVKNNKKPTEVYVIEEKKDESSERKTIVDYVDNEKIRKNDENKDTQEGNSEKEEDNIKKVENEEVDETEKNKTVVEVVP